MPKRQSSDAQMARMRQVGTGEKYTQALRAVQAARVQRFRMFWPDGAGWDPINEGAERQLARLWPDGPRPLWEEKFGELCWKVFPWSEAPGAAATVVRNAIAEAAVTCEACPSPGRKRVIWIWDAEYGWVAQWVKTCCDGCYQVPRKLIGDQRYRDLFERYEEPVFESEGCCVAIEEVTSAVREQFDHGGVPALLAELAELERSMWSRSPHHDIFSGHAVVLAVEQACTPLLRPAGRAGAASEPPVPTAVERRQVVRAMSGLMEALCAMAAEEHRD